MIRPISGSRGSCVVSTAILGGFPIQPASRWHHQVSIDLIWPPATPQCAPGDICHRPAAAGQTNYPPVPARSRSIDGDALTGGTGHLFDEELARPGHVPAAVEEHQVPLGLAEAVEIAAELGDAFAHRLVALA